MGQSGRERLGESETEWESRRECDRVEERERY